MGDGGAPGQLDIHTLVVGPLQANCYIACCREANVAVVIDPGDEPERIELYLQDLRAEPIAIVATHAHLDHVLGARRLCEDTGAPFLLHAGEGPVLEGLRYWTQMWLGYDPGPDPTVSGHLREGEPLVFGACELEVRLTPGHSPGSVSFVDRRGERVIVGDVLFQGSVGRSDLPGGDHATLIKSVESEIFSLPDEFSVLPGHGPETTVGHERLTNPFFVRGSRRHLPWLS